MNLKNKLRMCFFIISITVLAYLMMYYFYDGSKGDDLGQAILVALPCIKV